MARTAFASTYVPRRCGIATFTYDLATAVGNHEIVALHPADPKIRDIAAAMLLSEIFRIPPTVSVPHVDLEVKSALGKVYFVRLSPQRVVKLYAESTGDALEKARLLPVPRS